MVDLNEMICLDAVAREASFTRAARRLGMPVSTVSRRIASLEARLGVRLLHRTTRKVSLTEAGSAYAARCRAIVAEATEADLEARARDAAPTGTLRLTAVTLVGESFLPPVLAECLRRYPDLEIELVLTDRRVDLVAEGFDGALRMGELPDSTLTTLPLGRQAIEAFAAPGYLAGRPPPSTVVELAKHRLLAFDPGGGVPWGWWKLRRAPDRRPPLRVNSFAIVRDLALLGAGIGLLPTWLAAPDLAQGRLVRVLAGKLRVEEPMTLVTPPGRLAPTRLRAFVEVLRERLDLGAPAPPPPG